MCVRKEIGIVKLCSHKLCLIIATFLILTPIFAKAKDLSGHPGTVKSAQEILKIMKFYKGPINSTWDTATKKAFNDFQKKYNFKTTDKLTEEAYVELVKQRTENITAFIAEEINAIQEESKKELDKRHINALYDDAVNAMEAEFYDVAIMAFKNILEIDPEHKKAHFGLTSAYLKKNEYAKAEAQLEKLITMHPKEDTAYFVLGNISFARSNYDYAIYNYKKALEANPNVSYKHSLYQNIGVAYSEKGLHDRSIGYLKKAIELKPNYPKAYYSLGVVYHAKGLKAKAIKNYHKAIEINPNHVKSYMNIGVLFFDEKDYATAKKAWEYVIKLEVV